MLAHKLAKLAAPISPKAEQVAALCEALGMSLTTAYLHDALITECLNLCWVGLVRLVFVVFWQVPNLV